MDIQVFKQVHLLTMEKSKSRLNPINKATLTRGE